MEYKHFGVLLQELRTKYNISREKLAQNICTPKQIYRIEKGLSEPSIYLLQQLSIKFNLDLNEYYKMQFTRNTIAGLEGINSINSAIKNNDIPLIKSLIESYENQKDFKSGENLQHIYYGKALCSALLESNYTSSLEYCFKGIQVECPEFNIHKITDNMYSNVGITLLNCVSQNFFALDQYDNGMTVLSGLVDLLEKHVINSSYPLFHSSQFSKKMYSGILYNMSCHLNDHDDTKMALLYVNKGIEFSLKEYCLRHLAKLYSLKFLIQYKENNIEDATIYYGYAIHLLKITKKFQNLTELVNLTKKDYPEIYEKYLHEYEI